MRQEARVGASETGKLADIIVLDQDITSVATSQISNTEVLWTLIDGEEVWRDSSFCPPVPGAPDIRLEKVGTTGAQLSWAGDSFASRYNVLASPIPGVPTPPSFTPIGDTPDTFFDAPPSADGPSGAYFLVDGQNSCGQQSQ